MERCERCPLNRANLDAPPADEIIAHLMHRLASARLRSRGEADDSVNIGAQIQAMSAIKQDVYERWAGQPEHLYYLNSDEYLLERVNYCVRTKELGHCTEEKETAKGMELLRDLEFRK